MSERQKRPRNPPNRNPDEGFAKPKRGRGAGSSGRGRGGGLSHEPPDVGTEEESKLAPAAEPAEPHQPSPAGPPPSTVSVSVEAPSAVSSSNSVGCPQTNNPTSQAMATSSQGQQLSHFLPGSVAHQAFYQQHHPPGSMNSAYQAPTQQIFFSHPPQSMPIPAHQVMLPVSVPTGASQFAPSPATPAGAAPVTTNPALAALGMTDQQLSVLTQLLTAATPAARKPRARAPSKPKATKAGSSTPAPTSSAAPSLAPSAETKQEDEDSSSKMTALVERSFTAIRMDMDTRFLNAGQGNADSAASLWEEVAVITSAELESLSPGHPPVEAATLRKRWERLNKLAREYFDKIVVSGAENADRTKGAMALAAAHPKLKEFFSRKPNIAPDFTASVLSPDHVASGRLNKPDVTRGASSSDATTSSGHVGPAFPSSSGGPAGGSATPVARSVRAAEEAVAPSARRNRPGAAISTLSNSLADYLSFMKSHTLAKSLAGQVASNPSAASVPAVGPAPAPLPVSRVITCDPGNPLSFIPVVLATQRRMFEHNAVALKTTMDRVLAVLKGSDARLSGMVAYVMNPYVPTDPAAGVAPEQWSQLVDDLVQVLPEPFFDVT